MTEPAPEPARKPTRDELRAQKLALVRKMLEERKPISDIKRAFAKLFNCSGRSAEPWITEAYQQMRQEVERDVGDHKSKSILFYESVVGNKGFPLKERLKAQERLDKILGLEAEIKISTNGNTTVTVTPTLTPAEERAAVDAVLNGGAAHATPATGD